jgi:hypothetical protein
VKSLNGRATKIFKTLVRGLEPGAARYVDNAKGTFMRVAIDCLAQGLFAVAHRFEQNGDLCPDPDVEFYVSPSGDVFPTAIDQFAAPYKRYVEVVEGGGTWRWTGAERGQADLVEFCNMWMKNIEDQQRLAELGVPDASVVAG